MTDHKINPVGGLIRRAQDQLERRAGSLTHNESVLQQSNVWLRSVTWALVGTTVIGIGWLAIARTEEVVVAQGKLEPVGDVKDLQIPSGGVVKAILVKGGERVKEGQVLIELDQKSSRQELKSLQESQRQKQQQLRQKQQQLALKQQEKQRSAEINREQISSLEARLALEDKILNRLTKLAQEGASSELQYLQQQNKVEELRGSVSKELVEGRRQQSVLNQQIEQINAEIAGLRSDLAQLRAQITEAEVTLGYQSLRAPVDGVVFDLKLTTPGFVAQTGEPALKVVPFNTLEADVEIPSSKIGFVRKGQPAELSIDSFPATDFGVLEGSVSSVGSDALAPDAQKGRDEYRFPATITLDSQQLKLKNGTNLPLQVGMSLTANIKLRSVSYLQLLLNTFRSKTDSLREL